MNGPDGHPVGDLKDVVYEVVEGKTGKLNLGVALSGEGGLSANISYSKRNFDIARPATSWDDLKSGRALTGAGQTFNVFLIRRHGDEQLRRRVRRAAPLRHATSASSAGVRKFIGFRENYREDITGYYVRLSHPVYQTKDDSTISEAALVWRHEWNYIGDVGSSAVPGVFLFEGEHELRSLAFTIALRHVDNAAKPGNKFADQFSFEYAGGIFGSDLDFVKAILDHDQRWVMSEDDSGRRRFLTLAARVGFSEAFGDTPEVPPYVPLLRGRARDDSRLRRPRRRPAQQRPPHGRASSSRSRAASTSTPSPRRSSPSSASSTRAPRHLDLGGRRVPPARRGRVRHPPEGRAARRRPDRDRLRASRS